MPENFSRPAAPALPVMFPCPHKGGWRGLDTNGRLVAESGTLADLATCAESRGWRMARGWIMPRHNRARHRLTGAEARGILVDMESHGVPVAARRAAAGAFARMIARGESCATHDAECVYRDYATGAPAHVESAR